MGEVWFSWSRWNTVNNMDRKCWSVYIMSSRCLWLQSCGSDQRKVSLRGIVNMGNLIRIYTVLIRMWFDKDIKTLRSYCTNKYSVLFSLPKPHEKGGGVLLKKNVLISQPKQMFWVLRRTVLMRMFFSCSQNICL